MSDIALRIRVFIDSALVSLREERGQDLLEYALLGGLIAMAIIAVAALGIMSTSIQGMANGIGECIDFDGVGCNPNPF